MNDDSPALFEKKFYPWLIWFVGACFYGYELFQRVMPSVITHPLMETFHINAATFSSIVVLYFYAYAVSQLIAGVLIDRLGTRTCLTAACMMVALCTFFFARSESLWVLAAARIGVGIGSAFAFVGCLKLASNWFPKHRFALLVGLTNMLGVLGGLFSQVPLTHLINTLGWQQSLIFTSLIGLVLGLLILLVIQNHPEEQVFPGPVLDQPRTQLTTVILSLIRCRQTWLVALYAGIMVAPVIAFAELWAVPFLEVSQHLTPLLAASVNSYVFIGIAVGAPLNGYIAGLVHHRKAVMLCGNMGALLVLCLILFSQHQWSSIALEALFFCSGYFASTMLLCFSLATQRHNPAFSGTVIAFTNMIIIILGAVFQPFIGKMLDWFLSSHPAASYTTGDYQVALSCLPIILVCSLVMLYFIKEKN